MITSLPAFPPTTRMASEYMLIQQYDTKYITVQMQQPNNGPQNDLFGVGNDISRGEDDATMSTCRPEEIRIILLLSHILSRRDH